MNTLARTTLCLLLTTGLGASALATTQTVWRCGPDGRSYESQPCTNGRAVELPGARPEADVQAAQQVAAADQRLARQLREERIQRERELLASGKGLSGFGRGVPAADIKLRQGRPAKATSPSLTASRQARSPEAVGTSAKAARASRHKPG